jgi:glycosyltransferase involved in cell wall biosynthesis
MINVRTAPVTDPLVSVVVPTYRHARFIANCLDSILMQQCVFEWELIIGEDGSDDGTKEICTRYAEEHPERIRLMHRDRRDVIKISGKATGRANVIKLYQEARGRYIAICEGDDLWTDPLKLQRQVALLASDPNCAGCYHNSSVVDDAGALVKDQWRDALPDRLELNELPAPRSPFHTSSFVFRNYPWLKRMPSFFRLTSVGDLALFTLVAGEGSLRCVLGSMSAYRMHGAGITSETLHNGTRFHIERMRLWMYLDRHFPGRIGEAPSRVCGWHWAKIMEHTSGHERLSALRELFRDVPMWFVVRPRYALYLLRSALPR